MAGSLEGPLAKLTRAESQLDALQEQVYDVWPPDKSWPVRTEEHRNGLEYRFFLGELPSVDPDWLLWTGEIMFDLRSALDHLAYQLHIRHFRGKLPRRLEDVPMFPIIDSESDFNKSGKRRIRNLGQRDQRALIHLQPYVTRRDRWHNTRYWLSKLNTLHNIDKHRKLHLVTAAQNRTRVPQFAPEFGFQTHPTWGAVESHGHVETWTFAKPPGQMHDHGGATIEVTLNPEGEWIGLVTFLRRTRASVRGVLHRFSDRFPEINGAFDPPVLDLPPGMALQYSPRSKWSASP
jgi:hypothetical protein